MESADQGMVQVRLTLCRGGRMDVSVSFDDSIDKSVRGTILMGMLQRYLSELTIAEANFRAKETTSHD